MSRESSKARAACFFAAPSYLARRGSPRASPISPLTTSSAGRCDTGDETWIARRDGRVERLAVSPRIHARSAAGVVACAVAGLGVASGSMWMCCGRARLRRRVEVLADYALDPVTVYVIFPAGRRPSQKARAFSDYLEQALTPA